MDSTIWFKRFTIYQLSVSVLLGCLVSLPLTVSGQKLDYLFKNGSEGYRMYRIPTIVITQSGKLLAFCEGRQSLFDHGNIDIVMKTSTDQGLTWSPLQVVWDEGKNTCGNPSPVIDSETGAVVLLGCLNNSQVFVLRSVDDGNTWEIPLEITPSVKASNWDWYATGPVHGIQMNKHPNHQHRLVVPCNHTFQGNKEHISHVIYSDDGGRTWLLGGSVDMPRTDECTVAELSNGDLILNMRNNDRTLPNRKISISKNGGDTWSTAQFDSSLAEPVCQGALLSYPSDSNLLLFLNPQDPKQRKNLTLSISLDNGKSWRQQITIYSKLAAYSDLVRLPDNRLICIFETGKLWPYAGIVHMSLQPINVQNSMNSRN